MKPSILKKCSIFTMHQGAILAIIVLLGGGYPHLVQAEYDPPAGSSELDRLLSPRSLSIGSFGLLDEYPASSARNPAAGGLLQRTHLDISFMTAFGLQEADTGTTGYIFNLGGAHPTAAGVFTGQAQGVFSELQALEIGNFIRLQSAFAKELYENIAFGAGFDVVTGKGDQWDIGLQGSLGVIHYLSKYTDLNNARYGIALNGIGKWYRGYASRFPYPAPFSPSIEFAFTPVESANAVWDVYAQIAAPSFQTATLQFGTDLTIRDKLSLSTGLGYNLHSIKDRPGDAGNYLPTIGVNVRIPVGLSADEDSVLSERGWQQSEINIRASGAPLTRETWVAGLGISAALGVIDENPPEITIENDERVYISPNNDGIQDYLEFPLSITDERYIMGYRLIVMDEEENVVRTIENVDQRPETEGFRNIIDRLLAVQTGIDVPETLRWDGRTDSGSRAEDGNYTYSVQSWDDNDNLGESKIYEVVIDTQAPVVSIDPPVGDELIFSPNEESLQNSVRIRQSGSYEDAWYGEISNSAGDVVRRFEWKNTEPPVFEWDGFNNDGEAVQDGVYNYRVYSTDRAGNSGETSLSNIIINTEPTPISLQISRSIFSPNNNGVHDTIRILPDIGNTRGIRDWQLNIIDREGQTVRSYGDVGVPRENGIVFDGRNDRGHQLPEGSYHAEIVVVYRNGNRPDARSPQFIIDVTPPVASVSAEHAIFSPNNSGIRDTQIFTQESTQEEEWKGIIKDQFGRTVREFTWHVTAPARLEWDGRTNTGELASDGVYSYMLTATDRAGNTGSSNEVEFELNTEETPVLVTTNYDAFSPNGQGYKDTISIIPSLKKYDDIEYFKFEIIDSSGTVIRTAEGSDTLTSSFVWDGRTQNGLPADDGVYLARLEILYLNGNMEQASTEEFLLDTQPPVAEINYDYKLFSPDGNGRRDTVPIYQDSITEDFWTATIRNAVGDVVRDIRWGNELVDFEWDGRDSEGNLLSDGSYSYTLRAEDAAGNRAEYTISDIVIDTRPTSVFATIDFPAIAPGQSETRSEQKINLFVNLVDGADSWQLQILDSAESVVRSFDGENVESSFNVRWDGTNDNGEIIEGNYRARLIVDYEKGNQPVATTRSFLVDVSPPDAEIDLYPTPFSPDNDGIDDELNIELNLSDASGISDWRFEIRDRNNRIFHVIEGSGQPSRVLTWDGRSSITGDLVISAENYPYVFTVSDVLGNTAEYEGVIPVDILVIRDGDRLKVQIPSITFMPNSPELELDPVTEVGQKNLAIVERLVEIFTRYNTYSIQVEGHAVNITGTAREENEELQPLSLARAQAVMNQLVQSGLSQNRVSAVGRGGMEPIVPHTDEDERWKNRRVEFILIR